MIAQTLARAIADHQAGRLAQAEQAYRAILQAEPRHPHANHNLGVLAMSAGKASEALPYFQAALEADAAQVQFWVSYADALLELGRADAAAQILADGRRRGLAGSDVDEVSARITAHQRAQQVFGAATEHHQAGRLEAAVAAYRTVVSLRPRYTAAYNNLGYALQGLGRLADAEATLRRALDIDPNVAGVHHNLANVLGETDRAEEAAAHFHRALEISPDSAPLHYNLGCLLGNKLGRPEEAEASYRRAIELNPGYAEALCNLGNLLGRRGDLDGALQYLERAVAAKPDLVSAHKSLLTTLIYHPTIEPEAMFAAHRRFEDLAARPLYGGILPHGNVRDPNRRLRIGYLSSDLWLHSVARNLWPMARAHDRSAFEIHFYAEIEKPDEVTAMFRAAADGWRSTVGLSDENVASLIRDDKIDILVILAGRFDRNRPLVAAFKPAPIQISHYDAATSGMSVVDYLISDRVLTPRNTSERFTERLLCLPHFYLAEIPAGVPPVRPRPADAPPVFGCFNIPAKVTDAVLDLWARLLAETPGSRLILKYQSHYASAAAQARVHAALDRHGISHNRVSYPLGVLSQIDLLDLYGDIDIALDTFPFTGSTTTFEALIMGVPVLTLRGRAMTGCWSASMLTSLRLEPLIAETPADYIRIAKELAADPDRRTTLRATLRERVARSPLCDATGKAKQIERYYRAVWRRWCAAQPNAS